MASHATSLIPATLDADRRLGPYRVVGSLGRGAHAQVFKAEHRHLGQFRALKVLRPKDAARAETVARLVTEARAMARVRHPSIAEVFECDVLDDGTAFIAMEYLHGEPLHLWLDRVGKLHKHPVLAAAMAGTLAEALRFAHEQSVVHRDLKPENVLLLPDLSREGAFSLKLLDFGIAKLLREEPLTRTRAGCVIGTPRSMAPEQWKPNGPIDHRVDIYALGCLLFELLCGREVFPEINERNMMRAHLHDPPPKMASLAPGVSPALELLVRHMLHKSPDDRPQSMAEVISELASFIGHRRFGEVLQLPTGWSVDSRQTVAVEPTHFPSPLASFGRWTIKVALFARRVGRGFRSLHKWHVLSAVLAVLVAGGAWMALRPPAWLRPKEPSPLVAGPTPITNPSARPQAEQSRVADSSQVGRITAAPVSAARPAPESFAVRVTSVPAGVETWVEGEARPRGRTPIDLTFRSPGPRLIRLVAPGFQGRVLPVQIGHDTSTKVILVRQPVDASGRRTSQNVYQRVAD
jgi:tRNA A-37 threonylcarbamoyl transferase component Bud32